MQQLRIPFVSDLNSSAPLQKVSQFLDGLDANPLTFAPWEEQYAYRPAVSFVIAHTTDSILLKYYVQERIVQALYTRSHEPVYKDSCVEFFIAFDDEECYYNLEFNCTGTCLFGFGAHREARKRLPVHHINKIKKQTLIENSPSGESTSVNWELTLVIPFEVFAYHNISTLSAKTCRVNFYKCGDELPEPHYLSWSGIKAVKPDFHLPSFFGKAEFLSKNEYSIII